MNLQKLLIDVCKRAQLKKIPKLTMCKGTIAQSRLNKIRIGRRLRSHLTEPEMEGVIAHEVYHVRRFIRYAIGETIAEILLLIAVFAVEQIGFLTLARIFPTLILYVPPTTFEAIVVISIVLLGIAFRRLMSKATELRADGFAVSIVGNNTFASALEKVYSIQSKRSPRSRIWEWLNPHPSLNKRLEAIRNVTRWPVHARP